MGKMDEEIIVVPRQALFDNEQLVFQGTASDNVHIQMLMDNIGSNFGIMRRGDAEENALFKQPIPYAVIKRGHEIFTYERLEGGGETRLHSKLSIGVGGHMNFIPSPHFGSMLSVNLHRELSEELVLPEVDMFSNIIGFINDDSDEVGKVHIGILLTIEIPSDAEIDVREKDQLKGQWVKLSDLKSAEFYGRLENWSQITVDTLTK